MWFRDYGLTTKFNLLSIMLVLLTAVAITSYEIKREKENHLEAMLERGIEMSSMIAMFSEYALFSEDAEAVNDILSNTDDEKTTYLGLLRRDKSVLAEKGGLPAQQSFSVRQGSTAGAENRPEFSRDGRYIRFLMPIMSTQNSELDGFAADEETAEQQEHLGYVKLIFNTDAMRQQTAESILITLL